MIIRSASFHRAAYSSADFPRDDRPQFAVVGRSNVGKSSLINTLFKQKIARVSQTPGKTQALHFYLVNERFYLVDLPGYGYAKVPRTISGAWGELIREWLETAEQLRLLVLLLDARRVPSEDDIEMLHWALDAGVPTQIVITKTDKLSNNQKANAKRTILGALEVDVDEPILFSSVTREGVDRLWKVVDAAVNQQKADPRQPGGFVDRG